MMVLWLFCLTQSLHLNGVLGQYGEELGQWGMKDAEQWGNLSTAYDAPIIWFVLLH